MTSRNSMLTINLLVACLAVGVVFVQTAGAATVVIINADGPGEGFNDPTAVAPVGGNPGITVGQQRLNAFTFAANLWGACLESAIAIEVQAQMNSQFCDATSAVLGSAGATYVHRDFAGAPLAGTWYPQALANASAGVDLNPGTPEISATFNSNLNGDPGCLGGIGWYYGYDSNPGSDIDFISVVFHEIGHGIGFQTFQSSGGVWLQNHPDAYGRKMYHVGAVPPDYPSMNNPQRAACNVGDPNLVWDGAFANLLGNSILISGLNSGRVRLYAPNPYEGGSSLSHFSTSLTPSHVMEPFYVGANHDGALELQLLKDIGWVLISKCDPVVLTSGPLKEVSCATNQWSFQIQIDNTGNEDAFSVAGAIVSSPLTATDATCAYGDILADSSRCGLDSYTIDMTSWDGEPFNILLELTYDDSCGTTFTDTLVKVLDRPRPQIICPPVPEKQVAYNYPEWDIMLRLDNDVSGIDAVNVNGTLINLPVWMTPSADLTSSYGTIAPGDTACGNDEYRLLLTNWPGGSFPVTLVADYTDSCGIAYTDTFVKQVDPPVSTSIPTDRPLPAYRLSQNVPNPFNPTTAIGYELAAAQYTTLRIYDVSGRLVRTLIDEVKSEGRHQAQWDGKDGAGQAVSSGVYYYRLQAGAFSQTKRMVILK